MGKQHWQIIATIFLFTVLGVVVFVYIRKTLQLISPPASIKPKAAQGVAKKISRNPSANPNDWKSIFPALDWRDRMQSPKYYRDNKNQKVFYVDNKRIGGHYQIAMGWSGQFSVPSRPTFLEYIRIELFSDGIRREVILDVDKTEWQQAIDSGRLVKVPSLPK